MKILAICPSIYPDKLEKMYDSYDVTVSKNTQLVVINKKGNITEIINDTFHKYNDADFYIVLNDDLTFNTPLWDVALAHKGKISHGNDSVVEGVNGQFLMIDGDIVRALGWLQLPSLNRYCGDVVWRFIGEQLEILKYVPEVNISHHWEGCADPEMNKKDMKAFAEWLPSSHKDIERIRKIL